MSFHELTKQLAYISNEYQYETFDCFISANWLSCSTDYQRPSRLQSNYSLCNRFSVMTIAF